jgi:hypothetical protein
MALTVFFAICILGVDFLIYALLQWTWGDKRRSIARQVAAHRKAFDAQSGRPFLVPSRETASLRQPSASTSAGELLPRSSSNTRIA